MTLATRRSYQPKKSARWAGELIKQHLGKTDAEAKTLLAEWLSSGVLRKGKYTSKERHNQTTQKLEVVVKGRDDMRQRMAARV